MSVRAAVPTSRPKFTVERVLLAGIVLYLLAGKALPALKVLAEGDDGGGHSTVQSAVPGSPFTYQGRMESNGLPVSGNYDFEFLLWDAATLGTQVGVTFSAPNVTVTNGVFSVPVAFGVSAFDGNSRWIETKTRPAGIGTHISLGRTALTATPYALVAGGLALPFAGETDANSSALAVTNTGTGTDAFGITGIGGTTARAGVFGSSGENGVVGESANSFASGVYGVNSSSFGGSGVMGSVQFNGIGVRGEAGIGGKGVYGGAGDGGFGVVGFTFGSGAGVYGSNPGIGRGVHGEGRTGVLGTSTNGSLLGDGYGVLGEEATVGVRGVGAKNGVEGSTTNAAGSGVYGENTGAGSGTYGRSTSGDGTWGEALTAGKSGIVGKAAGGAGTNFAAYFIGNIEVLGTVTAGTKSFKIDHPLDPAGAWLYHSSIESPDMKNLYDGVVTTDADSFATVQLPDYFEALNRDFRYQLTVVGGDTWARARIATEVSGNAFVIETDQPNVTVSWQVTGIRHDAFAEAHRTLVEVAKTGDDLGTCVEPTACPAP